VPGRVLEESRPSTGAKKNAGGGETIKGKINESGQGSPSRRKVFFSTSFQTEEEWERGSSSRRDEAAYRGSFT